MQYKRPFGPLLNKSDLKQTYHIHSDVINSTAWCKRRPVAGLSWLVVALHVPSVVAVMLIELRQIDVNCVLTVLYRDWPSHLKSAFE